MGRAVERTAHVSLDVISRITDLFGTIANAHRQLGLMDQITYPNLYRALQGFPVKPEEKQLVEGAWHRWTYLYLRPEVPVSDELRVSVYNRDLLPDWHPDTEQDAAVGA